MIEKVETYAVKCDGCKILFTDGHTGFSLFIDTDEALEAIQDEGWIKTIINHYCPQCKDKL